MSRRQKLLPFPLAATPARCASAAAALWALLAFSWGLPTVSAAPLKAEGLVWSALAGGAEEAAAGEGDVHALDDGRWLLARADGLHLVADGGARLLLAGRFESLDVRAGIEIDGQRLLLLSMIDVETGQPRLALLDGAAGSLVTQRQIEMSTAVVEIQCLYRSPLTGDVSLFSVDARGMLDQRYVYNAAVNSLVDIPVRRDVGLLEAEGCAVDDMTGRLYIAEGPLGAWAYDAFEEADAVRSGVLLVRPFGALAGELEDIAVDAQGSLWVLTSGPGSVYRREPSGAVSSMALPDALEGVALSVGTDAGEGRLAVFDEARGSARTAPIASADTVREPGPLERGSHPAIHAAAQTQPVRRYGDAADDPAIYAPSSHEDVLILGTDKREGLAVYSLSGELRQLLQVGRLNNVDLLADFAMGDHRGALVAASNRSQNSIAFFAIENGTVRYLTDVATTLEEVYGLCLYASSSGDYVFINDTDGRYQQYRVAWSDGAPEAKRVREFRLPSQPEGCVADTQTQEIFMGEEAEGVWMAGAEPDGDAPRMVIGTSDALVADVEGMDIYRGENAEGRRQRLLVVSSQGSDSYAVYDLDDDYRLLATFAVIADLTEGIDGVSETDGLAVTSVALPGYPRGILVVQDGRNRMPNAPQNFKIIDWRDIDTLLGARDD